MMKNLSNFVKKHGFKIVVILIVILFVYYAYMNIYEHYEFMNNKLCVDIKNTNSGTIQVKVDVLKIDDNDVISVASYGSYVRIKAGSTHTFSFNASNYGYMVTVDKVDNMNNINYEINNLRLQKKYKGGKKNFWTGKRKHKYRCEKATTTTTVSSSGLTTKIGNIIPRASQPSGNDKSTNYSMIYYTTY